MSLNNTWVSSSDGGASQLNKVNVPVNDGAFGANLFQKSANDVKTKNALDRMPDLFGNNVVESIDLEVTESNSNSSVLKDNVIEESNNNLNNSSFVKNDNLGNFDTRKQWFDSKYNFANKRFNNGSGMIADGTIKPIVNTTENIGTGNGTLRNSVKRNDGNVVTYSTSSYDNKNSTFVPLGDYDGPVLKNDNMKIWYSIGEDGTITSNVIDTKPIPDAFKEQIEKLKPQENDTSSLKGTIFEEFNGLGNNFGRKPVEFNSVRDWVSYQEKLNSNLGEEEIKPVVEMSINDRFYNILSNNIATNMYDAASGNFVDRKRLYDKYWLDRELIFEEKENGTYLISVMDTIGNKVAMGYTDADTYKKYTTGTTTSGDNNSSSTNDTNNSSSTNDTNNSSSTNDTNNSSSTNDTNNIVSQSSGGSDASSTNKTPTFVPLGDYDGPVLKNDNMKIWHSIGEDGTITSNVIDTKPIPDAFKEQIERLKPQENDTSSSKGTVFEKFNGLGNNFGRKPVEFNSVRDWVSYQEKLNNNLGKEEIKPVVEMSINDRFYNILSNNIATNMYDAASGDFVDRKRLYDKYWLDKELIFEEKENGTYLISVMDVTGNKVTMGYTDADTYKKYMAGTTEGTSVSNGTGNSDVVQNSESLSNSESGVNSQTNSNVSMTSEESYSTSDSGVTVNEGSVASGTTPQSNSNVVDYAERYAASNTYSGNGDFKLTTDNKTYTDMSLEDTLEVAAVVYAEAAPGLNPDDALAVASVIANREDSVRADTGAAWGGYQQGLKAVVEAPGQFSTYGRSTYNEFLTNYKNGIIDERMQMCLDAVEDVKNGVRNNGYQAFRSSDSVSYSDNTIGDDGNRYKIAAQV